MNVNLSYIKHRQFSRIRGTLWWLGNICTVSILRSRIAHWLLVSDETRPSGKIILFSFFIEKRSFPSKGSSSFKNASDLVIWTLKLLITSKTLFNLSKTNSCLHAQTAAKTLLATVAGLATSGNENLETQDAKSVQLQCLFTNLFAFLLRSFEKDPKQPLK